MGVKEGAVVGEGRGAMQRSRASNEKLPDLVLITGLCHASMMIFTNLIIPLDIHPFQPPPSPSHIPLYSDRIHNN